MFYVLSRKGSLTVLPEHDSGEVLGADDQVEKIVSRLQRVRFA
jgi:hypothetical protein